MDNDKGASKDVCWEKEENCLLKPLPEYDQQNLNTMSWDVGTRLAVLVNILRPDAIILGDIEGKEIIRDYLSDVRDKIREYSINNHNKLPKVFLGHFGQEAASLGAASLVSREVFIQA